MQSAPPNAPNAGTLRIVLLAAVSALALALLYHFSALEFLRSGGASELLRSLGPSAPVAYVLLMGLLMTLWVPGTLIVLVGTAVFSPNQALLLNYVGSLTAALFGFATARLIGGNALQQLIARRAPTLLRFQRKLASEGFLTIFYLRLIPTPFNAISYLGGLSPVSAPTYLAATALAILPGSFAFTTLLGAGLEVLKTHSLEPLFHFRPIAGLLVFTAALLLPPRIKARYFPTMPDADDSSGDA
jgi:uncharacterized membrane protein YdjX (TVP38/TMEM64 family)